MKIYTTMFIMSIVFCVLQGYMFYSPPSREGKNKYFNGMENEIKEEGKRRGEREDKWK